MTMTTEALLHGVLGDAVPNLRRAVVEAERVVHCGGEVQSVADDRDDLAIARVAHALDRVAFDFRRRLGRLGRRARIYACENKADGCPNAIREPEHRLTSAKRGAALISFGVSVKNSGVSAIQPNAPSQ